MPDLQELHWKNELKVEQIRATSLIYTAQTIYLLGPEPRAALDHTTPLYTALGDTVNKVVEFTTESLTSQSNLVRSIQIQISEQMPLMWKPEKTLFNKHKYPPFTIKHNYRNNSWQKWSKVFECFHVFKCFTSFHSN